MNARRAYEILLRLYPRDYRARFSAEMTSAFEEAAAEHRQRGRGASVRFVAKELAGLLAGAAVEWMAKSVTDDTVRGRNLPDRQRMRPPGVSWEDHYGNPPLDVPEDVREAQRCVDASVAGMVRAIADHEFKKARFYSLAERKASERLRVLREKYELGE